MNKVVENFGQEWQRFDQSEVDENELRTLFESYFEVMPPIHGVGFDLGAGSGRWARFVAPQCDVLHIIEPSSAIEVAKRNLPFDNVVFHQTDYVPLEDNSCDFGYCLGVLHHVEDTEGALRDAVSKLKPGAPFLLYLYYALDNKPLWFRTLFQVSNIFRTGISRLPFSMKKIVSDVVAATIYFPLAKLSRFSDKIPLSQYRDRSFYTMRTDALDKLGTRIEKRFTKDELRELMEHAGLTNITFGGFPYWTAVGFSRPAPEPPA